MRFVCDAMLARLGRILRMLGNDTLIANNKMKDEEVLSMCKGRILLTRDKGLWKKALKKGIPAIFIKKYDLENQLCQLMEMFDIESGESRCTLCNGELEEIAPKYYVCKNCGKVYWEGSHWKKVEDMIKKLKDKCEKS